MKKSILVRELLEETTVIKLPASLTNTGLTQIGFGTRTIPCSVQTSLKHEGEDAVYISRDIISELKIPVNRTLHYFVKDETFHVGPLVGIFTAGFTESLLRPIGERSLFFAKLLTIEKSVGVCAFVFGAHLINWNDGTVNGYFYTEKEGWTKQNVPLPNVIYDRLPNRRTENHKTLKNIKQRLQDEYLIPWYNPGFFNKWEMYKSLLNEENLKSFLPETIYQPTFEDIETMVSHFKHVYIKPANGSLGFGIYQVVASEKEEAFYCRYQDGEENRLQKFTSLKKLVQYLFKQNKLERYLIQQGIDLIRYDNRPLDFRIHTNRDHEGTWRMTALAAKIAGRGSVTTHLNNGGMVKTLEELFPEKRKREELNTRLEEAVILLSNALAEKTEGFIGEIGFDIGLDRAGQIWLFEANSKPGRAIFSHPKLRKQDRLSRQLAMSYAIFLTDQGIQNPEVQYR